jgi:hypothetical protein
MYFPKFWARAKAHSDTHDCEIESLGWSDDSVDAARDAAAVRAQKTVAYLATLIAGTGDRDAEYPYPERVLREPVLERVTDGEGRVLAVLSRNAYGAVVLNTEDVAFVDVDVRERGWLGGLFARLSGRPADAFDEALARVHAVLAAHPSWAARIYRTRAGFRLLMTHDRVAAGEAASDALLAAFGSDPLYVRLCQAQKSFRARLTPKPWRIGLPRPPHRFPWRDVREEQDVAAWLQVYESACVKHATCTLVAEVGRAAYDSRIARVVELHDATALRDASLGLA